MSRLRATVKIRERDDEADDGYASEWCHDDDLHEGDFGVTLRWTPFESVFVPWAGIVRIDYEVCDCGSCQQRARQAA